MLQPQLANPFVIASCHFTGRKRELLGLQKLLNKRPKIENFNPYPGAIIIKSISEKGGDGKTGKRKIWEDPDYKFIRYTDGDKTRELLLPNVAIDLFQFAKIRFPSTVKIGLSVLLGENSTLKNIKIASDADADFIELNTKYLSRGYHDLDYLAKDKADKSFNDFYSTIQNILNNCDKPIWIKFARDIIWLRTKDIIDLSYLIQRNDISFVIANTKQFFISKHSEKCNDQKRKSQYKIPNGKAVIWGKCLYPTTYDIIKQLSHKINQNVSLIANGGITTLNQTKAILDAGVAAIEYCAFLHDGIDGFSIWKAELSSIYKNIS
ncbi:MAG: hypothetical protein APR63_14485 [Desulfuromonas sp. SDB]|nr:MAG: hypothetical protein APR63_14485 [Desulfuromonas sp. SDB]